jgi:hypothetical protein
MNIFTMHDWPKTVKRNALMKKDFLLLTYYRAIQKRRFSGHEKAGFLRAGFLELI